MTGALNGVNYVETGYAYCRNLGTDNHFLKHGLQNNIDVSATRKNRRKHFHALCNNKMEYFGFKIGFYLFRIAPLFSLGCVWTNSSTRFYIFYLWKYLFFLPGVSLSFNYIPLVNEVNLQIIYYSDLGNGNGPFAGGGELKCFSPSWGDSFLNGYNDLNWYKVSKLCHYANK